MHFNTMIVCRKEFQKVELSFLQTGFHKLVFAVCHDMVELLSSNLKLRHSVEVPLSKDFCRSNCVDASSKQPKLQCFRPSDMSPFLLVPRVPRARLCSHLAKRGRTGATVRASVHTTYITSY